MLTPIVAGNRDYFGEVRHDERMAEFNALHERMYGGGVQVSEISRPVQPNSNPTTYITHGRDGSRVRTTIQADGEVFEEVLEKGSDAIMTTANGYDGATAVLSPPPVNAPLAERSTLWSGLDIEVIVGTGEFGSGKSIFGASICPGPETLACDNEGSLTIYKSIGFQHWDMAKELLARYPNGYTPMQRYVHWRDKSRDWLRSGKYKVFITDPFSEIEAGCAQYVEKNPAQYGYTAAQFQKSSGLFWGAVKEALKADLDNLRTYCETIYLTVHMRNEFVGGRPSGKREPKGKETLFELASLFMRFEREPNTPIPAAEILKSRLAVPRFNGGELKMLAVLPPRLPEATPQAIRNYIATPPDYDKLKKSEKHFDRQMTADEKMLLEADVARSRAEAAQAELLVAERRMQLEEMRAKSATTTATPVPDQSAQYASQQQIKSTGAAIAVVDIPGAESRPTLPDKCTEIQAATIRELFTTLDLSNVQMLTALNNRGAGSIEALTYDKASDLCNTLQAAKAKMLKAASDAAAEPSKANPSATQVYNSGPCTQPQIDKVKGLIKASADSEAIAAKIVAHLNANGKARLNELTVSDAELLAIALERKELSMWAETALRPVVKATEGDAGN